MRNILNKSAFIFLFILIITMNVSTALISMEYIHYLEFSKIIFIFGIVAFNFYIFYKVYNKDKLHLKDIFIIILLILGVISYFFAFDKSIALNGTMGRYEGLRTLFSYYSFFLVASTIDKKHQQKLMYVLIFFGILQILIGTIQFLQIKNIFGYDRSNNFSVTYRFASGTFGNPNFYSTFILLIFMYIWSMLSNSQNHKILYLILFLIFGYGLFIGNTLGCILTSIIVLIISGLTKINKTNYKKMGVIIGSILIIISALFGGLKHVNNSNINDIFRKNIEEIAHIFENGLNDSSGNYRIYIWKESLKMVPKYYKTGIGIDNFSNINNGTYLCSPKECFDKAHNEYLQILLTEGIFTLIVYLTFIGYVIFNYIKKKDKNAHNTGLIYGTSAYLIQAFVNISVIQVAPVFYIFMGFIMSESKGAKQ